MATFMQYHDTPVWAIRAELPEVTLRGAAAPRFNRLRRNAWATVEAGGFSRPMDATNVRASGYWVSVAPRLWREVAGDDGKRRDTMSDHKPNEVSDEMIIS